ncbi:hypothetical protein, partial [Shewanella sp. T24-MNA-CIBAN-0130]
MPQAIVSYQKGLSDVFHRQFDKKYAVIIIVLAIFSLLFSPYFILFLTGQGYTFPFIDITICTLLFLVMSVSIFIDTQYSIPQHLEVITTKANILVFLSVLITIYFSV